MMDRNMQQQGDYSSEDGESSIEFISCKKSQRRQFDYFSDDSESSTEVCTGTVVSRSSYRWEENDNSISICENIEPLRLSVKHTFGVTPFGGYCFECCSPVGNLFEYINRKNILSHMKKKKHKLPKDSDMEIALNDMNNAIKEKYGNVENYRPWIANWKKKTYRCVCGVVFAHATNLYRHIRSMKKKKSNKKHHDNSIPSVMTTCGRLVEMELLQQCKQRKFTETSIEINKANTVIATENNNRDYVPIDNENRKWITTKIRNIRAYFWQFKRSDESLEAYLPSLKLLTINSDGPVIDTIKKYLELADDDCEDNDNTLKFFIECSKKWVTCYCREHVNLLDGKIRFQLQSYFEETILVNAGYNLNLNMREKEETIVKELTTMIKLSWYMIEKTHNESSLCKSLKKLKKEIIAIESEYNNVATDSAVEKMVERLVIQKYLHYILIEDRRNVYSMQIGHKIVLIRLFSMEKREDENSNSNNTRKISMRNCGNFGSLMSLHLHIYRLASASLVACTESSCWENIIDEVKESSLCHVLSPLINRVKQMNNEKIDVRKKVLKENGDIVIDEYSFPKCNWCRMVPKIIELFNDIFESIYTSSGWNAMVDLKNEIYVDIITERGGTDRDDVLHYNFYVNLNGKVIQENDLEFSREIESKTIDKLTALVMISLHGLGLGATRVSELFRIQQHQVYWKGGNFYYLTVSNKRKSSNNNNKKTVTHKLPASISRYLLLYDYIGREICKKKEQFLFTKEKNNIESGYDNKQFYEAFAGIFGLSSNCSCLVMRHLYTSICNYLFPGNNNMLRQFVVSTADEVAEMSGHSVETHQQFYSSSLNQEGFFDKYHHHLGADVLFDKEQNTALCLATESDVLHYLKVMFGLNAEFFSKLQQEMVIDSCNNLNKHTFCSIGCGGGKSISWMIPTLRFSLMGVRMKMTIVVVPYCFLLDHHVNSCSNLIGGCRKINIESLKGKDIEENILPNVIRDKASLPAILFVSLEAIRILIEYHYSYLIELGNENCLYKIYIDEAHTILSEINFRHSYIGLSKLATLNVPIALYSGTFQRNFISAFLNFMFGVVHNHMYNFIIDEKIFGDKLMTLQHVVAKTYLDKCTNAAIKYMNDFEDSNVHIIVSTKDEGSEIFNRLKTNGIDCEFICSDSKHQSQVATKWNNDLLKILITTTLGLVGNESTRTGLVCIVGLHYNLVSIVQAYGRVRVRRRTKYSKCIIFTAENNNARLHLSKEEDSIKLDELIGMGIVCETNRQKYKRSMTMASVEEWLMKDKGCRLVSLAARLGFKHQKCTMCDICTNSCVRVTAKKKTNQLGDSVMKRNTGIQLLNRLRQKCICCNRTDCNGTCVVMQQKGITCYHCLGSHYARQCKKGYKNILKGKACYSCYVYNYSQDCIHDHTECSGNGGIKERLRGLIQHDYLEKKKNTGTTASFIIHLAGIYGSAESFFSFLYKYKNWK